MNKKLNTIFFYIALVWPLIADDGYKMPPKAIVDIVDAPKTPNISISPNKEYLLLLGKPSLISIEELSQSELKLAGIRINPATNGRSRASTYNSVTIKNIDSSEEKKINGIPRGAAILQTSWSPDGKHIAIAVIVDKKINLYVAQTKNGRAKLLVNKALNTAYGTPMYWLSDSRGLIIKTIIDRRGPAPTDNTTPTGPILQENLGIVSPARTYQDLLSSPYDEDLFDHYMTSQVLHVNLKGKIKKVGKPGVIKRAEPSPDGKFILMETIHRPYSYLVPLYRFPTLVEIYDINGRLVESLRDIPLAETIPIGRDAVIKGPRSFGWRSDVGSTIYYVTALDGGDPNIKIDFRDEIFTLDAPFKGVSPHSLTKLDLRYAGVVWGNDQTALVSARRWKERRLTTWRLNPSKKNSTKIMDRSYEDRYNDPGSPMMEFNLFGRSVMALFEGSKVLMSGNGASPEGDMPFVDIYDLQTKMSTRLWRCEAPYYERAISIINKDQKTIITSRESKDETPNYMIRGLNDGALNPITDFAHPYPQMKNLYKEMVTYKRSDGIDLSATLYLPPGIGPKDGPLPLLVWAYPREFKTSKAASQVIGSPHRFLTINPTYSSSSALLMLSYGYAVLMGATMPILGEGDEEPNDNFIKQLVSSAQAAADVMVERKITTRDQIGIGGHSYGAFMTANLLAHSDIFQAGIARSGAYNRSLTPFGFQSEQRTFWEAPEIYFEMSPFMHAQKVNEPILLIHGEADNNSGTFPVQSRRYYHALKGHGATAKLVMLPHESHGYKARESVMHVLWETANWLDTYVKKDKKK